MNAPSVLLDTHVVWWLGHEPEKLSSGSVSAIRAASTERHGIALSAASVYELTRLMRRGRITAEAPLDNFLSEIKRRFLILPVDGKIAELAVAIEDPFPDDPMDRIIVTTAIESRRTLVTADGRILSSKLCLTCW